MALLREEWLERVVDMTQIFNFLFLSSANRNLAAKFPFQQAPVCSISLQRKVTRWQTLAYFPHSSLLWAQFRLQEWHIDSRCISKVGEKQLPASLCLSVCLPAWIKSVPARRIFVKFMFRNVTKTRGKNISLVKIGKKNGTKFTWMTTELGGTWVTIVNKFSIDSIVYYYILIYTSVMRLKLCIIKQKVPP